MDIDLKGYKANCGDMPMGDLIIHNGHRMTESETRMAVNWGIAHGYKSASELPDEVIDKICDPYCKDFTEYDDTPRFVSMEMLRSTLQRIQNCYNVDWNADDIMDKIEAEL